MLSWEVGRVKITRIVEMDLPVPAKVIPQATAADRRKSRRSCSISWRGGLRLDDDWYGDPGVKSLPAGPL